MTRIILTMLTVTVQLSVAIAQTPYTSLPDEKHPKETILNGIISKYILQNDPSFTWYAPNRDSYNADTTILNIMEQTKDKVQYVVFGGTWCDDTRFILPKFFKLQQLSGVADKNITFFGVNRQKHTLGNVTGAFKILNVPTIIVMKDGKEVGRVVEYGKTGSWDKELAALLRL